MLHPSEAGPLASNSNFVSLLEAYRASGGIAPGDLLGRLFEGHHRGGFVSLTRMLVTGKVFAFARCQSLWIPLFQFHSDSLSIRSTAQQVQAELPTGADGWSLGTWFAGPNDELEGQRPADLLDSQTPAVMNAARKCSICSLVQPSLGRAAQAPAPA